MVLFEEYKNHPDESVRERANNRAIAIGLKFTAFIRNYIIKSLVMLRSSKIYPKGVYGKFEGLK